MGSVEYFEITDIRAPGKGKHKNEEADTYRLLEHKLQQSFVTHGNNLIHALDDNFVNQVSVTRDSKVGRSTGRHLNVSFSRALVFGNEIYNKWSKLYYMSIRTQKKAYNYLPKDVPLQLLYQSIVYLYPKKDIDTLIEAGLGDYMEKARDSKTNAKSYKDPEEFLGEYYVYDRAQLPPPSYVLIGNVGTTLPANQRIDFNTEVLPKLVERFPKSRIVYFPNVSLKFNKRADCTGNLGVSRTGINVLKRLFSIEEGKILCTKVL